MKYIIKPTIKDLNIVKMIMLKSVEKQKYPFVIDKWLSAAIKRNIRLILEPKNDTIKINGVFGKTELKNCISTTLEKFICEILPKYDSNLHLELIIKYPKILKKYAKLV